MSEQLKDNSLASDPGLYSAQRLPSGTLTFLFTDIEGSTQSWEQYPEKMRVAMRRHDVLIESAVKQQAGLVVRPRGEGDSRFAVFPRASDALRAAVAIQRLFFAEPWTIPPLRVRIALHSGEAELRDGDYYGCTVNRCARLRSAAHGGQILISQTTYCLVRDDLPAGVSLRDLGEYNLKDLERPEHIFQPVLADLPADFPPLNTPDQIHNNLPLTLTSFIGRQQEINELERLLWQSRLLTIAGPGGAGKTRLVIQAALNVQGSFPDGVWFIDLAPLSNSLRLSQYMMNLLGVREEAGCLPYQSLLDSLRSKTLLLILDNCEHLLPELAQLVDALLRGAPGLRILATSREKLAVSGEIVWRIPPLSSPDLKETVTIENLMQYEAVKLFSERAMAAWPDFTITRENVETVAQICAHLDGIPLAIELAAARVRVLSVEEILARLADRFRLLVGTRTALPRQQTLRALIDWSYDLLNEKERALLRRLSVFAGSWTLEAAEQVCSGRGMEASEVLDLLTGLIDKSFVIGEPQKGHTRYRFLETILKFSQERLCESQEADEFAQKHALYFLKVAEKSYGKMWGSEQAYWLGVLDEERDNLRTALDRLSQIAGNEGMMLQLAGSLWRYWEIRGYFTEGRAWLETALTHNPNASQYLRANGLGGAGHLARQQGDYEQAKAYHEQSLALFRAMENKLGTARQLNALGEIAQYLGDYARSVELHEESLALRYEIGDAEGISVSLRQLGVIAREHGQYRRAKELLEQSLKLERDLGDKLLLALSLNDLGLVAHALCDYEQAVLLFEEAMSLQRELNDRLGISNSLLNLGNVAKDRGIFKQAQLFFQQCLALKKELGDKRGIARVINIQAESAFWQGKYPLATDLARQGLTLSQELGFKRGVLNSLELLGFIAYYQGNYERAASLAGESLALSTKIEAPRAIAYAKLLLALGKYSEGSLVKARNKFQEAIKKFQEINDYRNVAGTFVNLARVSYRLGDHQAAMQYLDESKSISQRLNIRWTHSFVLEIMGLLQRSDGHYQRALELFQESLRLAVEQENQQGIANCLGALAGLAVMANQAPRAARLFAAAARLRREMGAKMSSYDRLEYEQYLTLVHEHLDHASFEAEWSQGFTMNTEEIIKELNEWSCDFEHEPLPKQKPVLLMENAAM
jgi:predicted ATPase/class 3 adenylate cyclase/Tfp pilus assembly protein PilF